MIRPSRRLRDTRSALSSRPSTDDDDDYNNYYNNNKKVHYDDNQGNIVFDQKKPKKKSSYRFTVIILITFALTGLVWIVSTHSGTTTTTRTRSTSSRFGSSFSYLHYKKENQKSGSSQLDFAQKQLDALNSNKQHDAANIISINKAPQLRRNDPQIPPTTITKVRPLTPQQDKSLLLTSDATALHMIFSTDCSPYQDWQSYLLFYSALRIKQPGHVTRIASGCSEEEIANHQRWHEEHIATMSTRFHIHFTPKFSSVKDKDGKDKGDYKYFNKPFGLRHFLEHSPFMGLDKEGEVQKDDTVIILIDPDMYLLRPITHDYSNERDVVIGKPKQKGRKKKVAHGVPFAQSYGMGMSWVDFPLDYITGDVNSPAKKVEKLSGRLHYPGGPPYIGTARDMHAIAVKWADFAPRLHEGYPHLLAEMYAYCVAAAHLELPHELVDSLMVSADTVGGEGWPLVDAIPDEEVCEVAMTANHEAYPIPNLIHYCQTYKVKEWFWQKRKVPKDLFTCDKPIVQSPSPDDIAAALEGEEKSKMTLKRNAFVLCSTLNGVAEAMEYYKEMHCEGENVNMERTLKLTH